VRGLARRGVTYYNLVSNQFTGLHGITVPGTLRDSLMLLPSSLSSKPNCSRLKS